MFKHISKAIKETDKDYGPGTGLFAHLTLASAGMAGLCLAIAPIAGMIWGLQALLWSLAVFVSFFVFALVFLFVTAILAFNWSDRR